MEARKGKKKVKGQQDVSVLSNSRRVQTEESEKWVPPAEFLQKYSYMNPKMDKNYVKNKSSFQDKKLAHHLQYITSSAKTSAIKAHEHDSFLLPENQGLIEVENDLERTWKVTQREIVDASAIGVASKAFSLKLDDFGPYVADYTRNGRHLALAGRKGHVATFDWHTGKLHTELQLGETCRAIRWFHDESFFAVAQKQYVYVYDKSGLEVHQLRSHIQVNQMEFLPYHFLLATIGNPGYLKYQDTSTGQLVAEMRTKLGACNTMAQNPHNAFIHLGHQNGTVTLWSPSVPRAQVQLQAHRGPVTSIAVDPSTLGTRMVTTGLDGTVKVWDIRNWKVMNEYMFKKTPNSSSFSQKGLLGLGWGNHISVFNDLQKPGQNPRLPPSPYLTHLLPGVPVTDVRFCPYEDVLGVSHSKGFTSLVVPGAGEANFDSLEADPYEGKRRRREREVNALLDKIPFDLITLDTDLLGKLDPTRRPRGLRQQDASSSASALGATGPIRSIPFVKKSRFERLVETGKANTEEDAEEADDDEEEDEDEEDQARRRIEERKQNQIEKADAKKRGRGRNSTLKKMLRKRKRNVIDPQTLAIKEKMAKNRLLATRAAANAGALKSAVSGTASALDRFTYK